MPSYVMPKDLENMNKPIKEDTASNKISQGNEMIGKINDLLGNANKFMDNLQIILNRKIKEPQNPQELEASIEAKANKLYEQKQQFNDGVPMELNPPQTPIQTPIQPIQPQIKEIKYKITVDRDKAVEDLLLMIKNLEQKKTIKQYLDEDLKQLNEMGLIHSAVEQWILKYVKIEVDNEK
jgi:hypothetical protein